MRFSKPIERQKNNNGAYATPMGKDELGEVRLTAGQSSSGAYLKLKLTAPLDSASMERENGLERARPLENGTVSVDLAWLGKEIITPSTRVGDYWPCRLTA